jgi:hypothetical protein
LSRPVFVTYLLVTGVTAAANGFSATTELVHASFVLEAMSRTGVPEWALSPLGTVKWLGVIGLLAGIVLPRLGIAAATGLTLFYVGALATNLIAGVYDLALLAAFLLLAIASLGLAVVRVRRRAADASPAAAAGAAGVSAVEKGERR